MTATATRDVPEVAFRKGFHRMTAYNMAQECQAMLAARPAREFEQLQAGKSYYHKPTCGEPRLVAIGQTTPKGRQAVASVNQSAARRIYKGDFYGPFIELDADLCALAGVTHENIVTAAVNAKMEVPPEVRREYPALFVEIPERFAQPNNTAAERVAHALSPDWVMRQRPLTPADLDAQIEEAHRQIAVLQDTRCQAVTARPDNVGDYDRYIDGHRADIDFYRWLRRHIDVGGVFYIAVNGHAKK